MSPERKSSAIDTMPCAAMAWWRRRSDGRSLMHQAPPWHSTSAGNGPSPRGRNTRASSGLSPWRRYSTSSTSNSWVLVSSVAVVMAAPVREIEPCRSSRSRPMATTPGRSSASGRWSSRPRTSRPHPPRRVPTRSVAQLQDPASVIAGRPLADAACAIGLRDCSNSAWPRGPPHASTSAERSQVAAIASPTRRRCALR